MAKAVYIIGKLPKDGPSATGLRATNDTIADLLIEDLRTDGARMRERVPAITRQLAERGILLEVEGAYLLQTPAAAEWAADYQAHIQDLRTDVRWQADHRTELLREAFAEVERGVKPRQGKSLVTRKVRVSMSADEPKAEPGEVAVWVRDGWSVTDREVREDAQRVGTDSPLVLVWIPKEQADELRAAMVEAQAAKATVDLRAVPTTDDGRNARAGLISRRDDAKEREQALARRIVAAARVYQGGGNEVAEPSGNATLGPSLTRAVDNAVLRLFPDFAMADDTRWDAVIKRAKDGSADALVPLGHRGEVDEHPVPKAILAFLGAAGKRGSDVLRRFQDPPYGWPKDAIDGSLLALISSGKVHARHNGEATTASKLTQNIMGVVDYRAESVVPTGQRPDACQGSGCRPRHSHGRHHRGRTRPAHPRRPADACRCGRWRGTASCAAIGGGGSGPRRRGWQCAGRQGGRREGRTEGGRGTLADPRSADPGPARPVGACPAPAAPRDGSRGSRCVRGDA